MINVWPKCSNYRSKVTARVLKDCFPLLDGGTAAFLNKKPRMVITAHVRFISMSQVQSCNLITVDYMQLPGIQPHKGMDSYFHVQNTEFTPNLLKIHFDAESKAQTKLMSPEENSFFVWFWERKD